MIYTILGLVFIAVFGFIAWRIFMKASSEGLKPDEAYVCPICNDQNCFCEQKKNTGKRSN